MLKMMIADDEPKIRRDLRESADWENIGIAVVGEAEDGEIALRMAEETRPDILLVDINMPFLNGLEFISRIRQILTESKIIIITVYDDFDYAQQAVRLQIFDYILKPIDRDQLLGTIERAKGALENGRTFRQHLLRTDRQLKKNIGSLRRKFLLDLANGRLTVGEAEDQAAFFQVPSDRPYGIMAVRVLDKISLDNAQEAWDRKLLLYAVQNIVKDLVSAFQPNDILLDEKENILVLSPVSDPAQWESAREEIENTVGKCLRYIAVAAAAIHESGLATICDAYRNLIAELQERCECTPIVILIRSYMEENFCNPDLSLQEAAEKIRISPSYLSKVLKKEIGLSFIDFLTQLRIKKAIQLMKDPCEKIREIAEKVGYSDQHYFSTAFKKVLGISPAEYRRRRQNN